MTDILESYKKAMRLYATFDGRTRRKDFWFYVLAVMLMSAAIAIVEGVILGGLFGGGLVGLFNLVHFVPSLAVAARRLHDTNKSAWWLLLMLVPGVGFLVLLIFCCVPGDAGANRFGPDPKA